MSSPVDSYKAQQSTLLAERDALVAVRHRAEAAVPPEQLTAAQARNLALEQQLADAHGRLEQQRTMAMVATQHLQRIQDAQDRDQTIIQELRRAVLEFEQQTDDHALVGKVEHELMIIKLEKHQCVRNCF